MKTRTQMSYIFGDRLSLGMYVICLIVYYMAFVVGYCRGFIAGITERLMKH